VDGRVLDVLDTLHNLDWDHNNSTFHTD